MSIYNSKMNDMKIESVLQDWLDKYFWLKLPGTYERVHDRIRQFQGIDCIHTLKNGKQLFVDSKFKYKSGCFNRVIDRIGFEVSKADSDYQYRSGWFIQQDSKTTLYSMISVFADCQNYWDITYDNITRMIILLVKKGEVKKLQYATGSDQDIFNIAKQMRDDYQYTGSTRKYVNKDCWMTYTPPDKYPEEPVNFCATRDILKGLPGTKEVEITSEHIIEI